MVEVGLADWAKRNYPLSEREESLFWNMKFMFKFCLPSRYLVKKKKHTTQTNKHNKTKQKYTHIP